MIFELFVAIRYLRIRYRESFISLVTLLSVGGVALGVCALVVVLSIMAGFEAELIKKTLGLNPHIVVFNTNGVISNYRDIIQVILNDSEVIAATPYIYGQVMLVSAERAVGSIIRGVEISEGGNIINLDEVMVQGCFEDLKFSEINKFPGVILGSILAKQLGIAKGMYINIINPLGEQTPFGRVPKSELFRVVGIFEIGMSQYDSTLSYVAMPIGQDLLNLDCNVNGIEVKVKDIYRANQVGKRLVQKIGPSFLIRDWMVVNHNLFTALKLEKITMFLILILIVLVAAFGIVSSLIMLLIEKTNDIGIFKTMGCTDASVRYIFMLEGIIIGFIGTIIGISIGLIICWFLARYKFIEIPRDVYILNTLPVQVDYLTVFLVGLCTMLISLGATIYPSYKAGRMDPIHAIRYE